MDSASLPSEQKHPSADSQPESSLPSESETPETHRKLLHSSTAIALVAIVILLIAVWQIRSALRQGPSEVIKAQLNAFNRDDFDKAYTYAAAGIRQRMPVEEFRAMIETGYPQFAKSKEVRLGRPEVSGESALVEVTLTGKDGITVHARYFMDRELDGWKVAGVQVDRYTTASKNGNSV